MSKKLRELEKVKIKKQFRKILEQQHGKSALEKYAGSEFEGLFISVVEVYTANLVDENKSLEKKLEELGKHNGELERELHYLPKKHELEIKKVIYDITYCDGIEIPTVLEKLRELNQSKDVHRKKS